MRSMFRTVFAVLVAVLATSAVASASASAAECPDTVKGGDYAVCVENPEGSKKMEEYEGKLSGTSGTSIIKTKFLSATVEIECKKDTIETTTEDGGKFSKGSIQLNECKVNKPNNCKVGQPIYLGFYGQLATPPAAIEDTLTGSNGEERFTRIGFEGCLGNINGPISGTQKCSFDAAVATNKKTHEMICTFAGSHLRFGQEKVEFSITATVHTAPTEFPWAILES